MNAEVMSMVLNWKAEKEYLQVLTCPHCSEVFRSPQRLPCGHSFCGICLGSLKQVCWACGCKFDKNKVTKDRLASNLIDELKLACDHGGCDWEGCFEEYRDKHHVYHLKLASQPLVETEKPAPKKSLPKEPKTASSKKPHALQATS